MSLAAPENPTARLEGRGWTTWLAAILPGYCTAPFAPHHQEFWEWVWSIESGERPKAFLGIWARGGAKSTSAEAGAVALGGRGKRRYGLYVCDIQDRADDHVGNIGSMLESDRVEMFYPEMASRRVGKYGNSRGWRRNRLWTSGGFVIDAIGLDTAARGVKLEDQRPDLLIIDDIDRRHDTAEATKKKAETLTESVIPAGSDDVAILGIQNLVKSGGVFDQLATGKAEFLRRRRLSGPIPAVRGLKVERHDVGCGCDHCAPNESDVGRDVIVEGEATWEGQSLAKCEDQINDWGLVAFRREGQHEVADAEGALWSTDQCAAAHRSDFPDLDELVVSVDPSGGKGKGHDDQAILAVGRHETRGFVIEDATCSLSPMGWGKRAVHLAVDLNADRIIVEDNYGGAMTVNTIVVAADALVEEGVEGAERFGSDHSGRVQPRNAKHSKKVRAEPCAALYGEKERPETWADGRMYHVGDLSGLETEQRSWEPDGGGKSPNRIDALAHAAAALGLVAERGRRLRYRGAS